MKVIFTPCIGLKDLEPRDTLEQAFRDFYAATNEVLSRNEQVSSQYLSSCWIQPSNRALPFFFDDLVTIAKEAGWLVEGKLV